MELTWQGWATLASVALVFGILATTQIAADVVLLGALTLLLVTGVVNPSDALSGLANEGMVTVGILYIVVAGMQETGATTWLAQKFLGRPKSLFSAQVSLITPTAALSAFINNTPVVAMFLPIVSDWARKYRLPASKLMIPLSYAAILGGTCTLIGTSTNLVVYGMAKERAGIPPMGFFHVAWVGLPSLIVGVAYLIFVGRWLLPDRGRVMPPLADPREYSVEMIVEPGSPLDGKTIEEAGLRHLPGLFVAEIERQGDVLPAVSPMEKLRGDDRLVLVGVVDSVVDLQKFRGLKPATEQVFKLDAPRSRRCLIEAVVSNSSPLIGMNIREGRFRSKYNAVVIAVARSGERIRAKIGDIVLRAGDTLLLEAHPNFVENHRNSRDFFLVSQIVGSSPPRHERAWVALLIMAAMVTVAALGLLAMLEAVMLAAGAMLITRCCHTPAARQSVDWQVLMTIAASIGLGKALESSGAAGVVATRLVSLGGDNPYLGLALIYLVTMLLTELITNNAAAVLAFPIAVSTAQQLGVNPMPFVMSLMMAASASFSTPIGYQTNLMVYNAGGYRFTDFLRVGLPLNLLMFGTTVMLAPKIWPFQPA